MTNRLHILATRLRRLAAVSLFHGTTVKHKDSIKDSGLIPQVGRFVSEMYGDENIELPELVFMSDKKGLHGALTAMVKAIANELGKGMHDVTDEDIYKHGLLVKLRGEPGEKESELKQRPREDSYEWEMSEDSSHVSVEPGDYYSEDVVEVDDLLTRDNMLRVFRRHGVWPRTWGPSSREDKEKKLLELFMRKRKGHKADEIRKRIEELSDKDLYEGLRDISKR